MTGIEPDRRSFLASVLGGAAALSPASGWTGTATGESAPAEPVAHEAYAVDAVPGDPGEVWVQLSVEPGPGTESLTYDRPADGTVIAHRGFDPVSGGLRWDGSDHPAITYTASPTFGWAAGDRWGFARKAELVLERRNGTPTRSFTFPRGGYGHPDLPGQSYVGPCETTARSIGGASATYVRPGRWSGPAAPPAELYFDVLETTTGLLGLDEPFPTIGYAAPSLEGSHGIAKRGATARTARPHFAFDQRSPTSIAHEFVHTQQDYFVAREYRWLLEGVATFYEHRVGYRYGLTPLSPLDGRSVREPIEGSRRSGVVYDKGAAVCLLLDRELRELRDGAVDLGDVLATLNAHDHGAAQSPTIDHGTFTDLVAETASARLDGWLDERISEPREIRVPDDVEAFYPGPDAPRPRLQSVPAEVTPSGPEDRFGIDVAVATRDAAVDALDLTVTATAPDAVRLGEVDVVASDSEYELGTVRRQRRSRTLSVSVEYPSGRAPGSLAEAPPVVISLDPVGTAATRLRVTGTVIYRDGSEESFATGRSGTRAVVGTEPPAEPTVVPGTVPVAEPVELAVVDPDPDAIYLWRFGTDGGVGAIGPQVTHRFGLLGETGVTVTAVDRAGNRTTGSTTLSVTDGDGPLFVGDVDEHCLLRAQGERRRADGSEPVSRWLLERLATTCSGDRSDDSVQ